jgi:Uma2 family endonuclease
MAAPPNPHLSVEDYLAGEDGSEILHEYINGEVYAMSGASSEHNVLAGTLYAELRRHLRGKPCRVFSSGLKLFVRMAGQDIFYYPDVMVACDPSDDHRHYRERPTVLVEVLSESTERVDTREKLATYIALPSVQEYLIVAQDRMHVTLRRRETEWTPEILTAPEEVLVLPSVGFRLPVAELYSDVIPPKG